MQELFCLSHCSEYVCQHIFKDNGCGHVLHASSLLWFATMIQDLPSAGDSYSAIQEIPEDSAPL
jgi:hypothetical protein